MAEQVWFVFPVAAFTFTSWVLSMSVFFQVSLLLVSYKGITEERESEILCV